MKYLIIILLSFNISVYAYEGTPSEQVENFFKDISSGKINNAIDNLYSTNPVMKTKIQSLTMLKQQLASVNTLFGKNIGNENIHNENLSPSIIRIVQISKHTLHPITWEFYFYKPKDKWILSQASFADRFQFVGKKK